MEPMPTPHTMSSHSLISLPSLHLTHNQQKNGSIIRSVSTHDDDTTTNHDAKNNHKTTTPAARGRKKPAPREPYASDLAAPVIASQLLAYFRHHFHISSRQDSAPIDNIDIYLHFLSHLKREIGSILKELRIQQQQVELDSDHHGKQDGKIAENWTHRTDLIRRTLICRKYDAFRERYLWLFNESPEPATNTIQNPSLFDLLHIKKKIFIHSKCQWRNVYQLMKGCYVVKMEHGNDVTRMWDDTPRQQSESSSDSPNVSRKHSSPRVLVMKEMNEFLSKNLMQKHEIHDTKQLNQFVRQKDSLRDFIQLLKEKDINWVFVHYKKPISKEVEYLFSEHGMLITNVSPGDIRNLSLFLKTRAFSLDELLSEWNVIESFPVVDRVEWKSTDAPGASEGSQSKEGGTALLWMQSQNDNFATLELSSLTDSLTSFCHHEMIQLLQDVTRLKTETSFLPPPATILAKIMETLEESNEAAKFARFMDRFSDFCHEYLLNHGDYGGDSLHLYSEWKRGFEYMLTEASMESMER